MTGEPIQWSRLYECRKAVNRRYRSVWRLPLAKRPSRVALAAVEDGWRVLEVGAADRRLARRLRTVHPGVTYESMDVDRSRPHDYYSMAEVAGPYDAAILFEVIEHLTVADGRDLLVSIREVLRPGGVVIVSTPNVYNPSRFWRDATHETGYAYDELGGLLTMTGFALKRLVRTHNDPVHRLLLRRYVFGWLFRLLNLDYADSIVAVAERPPAGA